MKLTKAQREQLRMKFHGHCAYCGALLGPRWHADHFEAVERKLKHVPGVGHVQTGEVWHPQRQTMENMMPACAPCNIDKHTLSLESWRQKLQNACAVLSRNSPTYRHAVRFGLIHEVPVTVRFYFEANPSSP